VAAEGVEIEARAEARGTTETSMAAEVLLEVEVRAEAEARAEGDRERGTLRAVEPAAGGWVPGLPLAGETAGTGAGAHAPAVTAKARGVWAEAAEVRVRAAAVEAPALVGIGAEEETGPSARPTPRTSAVGGLEGADDGRGCKGAFTLGAAEAPPETNACGGASAGVGAYVGRGTEAGGATKADFDPLSATAGAEAGAGAAVRARDGRRRCAGAWESAGSAEPRSLL
jgi:hypothetical protein